MVTHPFSRASSLRAPSTSPRAAFAAACAIQASVWTLACAHVPPTTAPCCPGALDWPGALAGLAGAWASTLPTVAASLTAPPLLSTPHPSACRPPAVTLTGRPSTARCRAPWPWPPSTPPWRWASTAAAWVRPGPRPQRACCLCWFHTPSNSGSLRVYWLRGPPSCSFYLYTDCFTLWLPPGMLCAACPAPCLTLLPADEYQDLCARLAALEARSGGAPLVCVATAEAAAAVAAGYESPHDPGA